jgi:outer membrane receptor protein involved in Fe transport
MRSFNRGSGGVALTLRLAASVAVVALGHAAQAQEAQTAAADSSTLETIEVTGSLIREPNITSVSPVVTVSAQELKQEGIVNVEDLLNNLPSTTPDQTSSVSNGSSGIATVDLRGLGSDRTLVLIDGQRVGPGDARSGVSAVDLNFIPAAMIQSVDVLTGGASVDYGSDAVAGVVNFHLKQDFQGVEIDQTFKIAQHNNNNSEADAILAHSPYPVQKPGEQLDGFVRESSLIFGVNGDNGRSNVTMYLTDEHLDPVLEGHRDWSDCTYAEVYDPTFTNVIGHECGGSSTTPYARTYPLNGAQAGNSFALNPNGTSTYVPFTDALRYNYGATNYIQRSDDRYTAGGIAHYDIADWATLYASGMFMDDHTVAQIAASGLFFGNVYNINCDNPLASAQQLSILGCAPGSTADTQALIGLRTTGHPRQDDLRHTDYRLVIGAKGEFYPDWTYDVSAKYYVSSYAETYLNDVSINNINNALEVVNVGGVPTCKSVVAGTSTSCVPLNIFKLGGISNSAFNYISVPGVSIGSTTETTATANVSGDFGQWGGKSPLATNPIAVAFGYQYRYDGLNYDPDNEFRTGDLAGQGGPTEAVNGSLDDSEFYGEVHIPVIEDLPFAKLVDVETGLRNSHYQVYGTPNTFNSNSWKLDGHYAPTSDVTFRGGFNRSERAPNADNLFSPQGLADISGNDPCSGSKPAASLAACANSGVTAAEYGKIVNCISGQCSGLEGGNPALKPEVGQTWTWGFVATPRIVPNFTFSVDYFDIQVDHYIESAGNFAGAIVTSCVNGNLTACPYIHRAPGTGILFGTSGYIDAGEVNAGSLHETGLDFEANYAKDLADFGLDNFGKVKVNFTGTYTMKYVFPYLLGGNYDCAGLYGTTCGSPEPEWRHKMRLTWESPYDADFSVLWRHISGVYLDNNSSDPLLNGDTYGPGAINYIDNRIPSFDYFDLDVTYHVKPTVTLTAGITNLFDRDPPVIDGAISSGGEFNGNTWAGTYDTLGRVFFVEASVKF